MKTILCVDNDGATLSALQSALGDYRLITASNRGDAIERYRVDSPDLVIVDPAAVGLPPEDYAPGPGVIVISDSADCEDIGAALEGGADDYVVKPFSGGELSARVKALLRRTQGDEELLIVGPLTIDINNYTVTVDGADIHLTLREYEILRLLAENNGKTLSRDYILNAIWGFSAPSYERNVDVMIRRIRKKLGEKYRDMVRTVTGEGYRINS